MQIFLSFPSELESVAEEIAQSLRNRDYDVFFSHDDLPAGDSFDARVEAAISKSDFMVFLISPESITRGRYTLTEMGFARDKWPNPSKRVLPVMAAPTPLDRIPNYLKAVTILEPEGNMAAETRAAVDRMLRPAPNHVGSGPTMIIFAALAIVSAIGSYLAIEHSPEFLKFSFIDAGAKAPILAGVMFGSVVAACSAVFGIRDRFQLALVIIMTTLAWVAAFDTGAATAGLLGQYAKQVSDAPSDAAALPTKEYFSNNPLALYIVGLIGGAVGGALTILGLLFTNPGFRRLESVMVSWTTATIVGALAYGLAPNIFLLFVVWQPAVILAIVRGFSAQNAQLPAWLEKITASASYTSRGAG